MTATVIRFPSERRQPVRLLTMRELCERYGYSERFWRYKIAEGMPCRRWANRLRFDPEEVEQWMEGRYAS